MNQVSSSPHLADEDPNGSRRSSSRSNVAADSSRPAFWGLVLCAVAALGYSVVNACLRQLTVDCDRVLVIFVKESVTVVVVGPWLAWQAWHGRSARGGLPVGRVLVVLAVAGLLTQLAGNLPNLWAFSVIGLAVAMPVMSGTNLASTAILGRVFLGERVSVRAMVAIGLLFLAVFVLCLAAPKASRVIRTEVAGEVVDAPSKANVPAAAPDWRLAGAAIAAACVAGIAYAILVVVIRRTVTTDTPTTSIVFMITVMAVVSLGPWLAVRHGTEVFTQAAPFDYGLMLLAGALNLLSFLAFAKGLQWTPVTRANLIMTSQVAIGAIVGTSLFGEPASVWLVLGVCLTIVGMIVMGREVRPEPETPETPV